MIKNCVLGAELDVCVTSTLDNNGGFYVIRYQVIHTLSKMSNDIR